MSNIKLFNILFCSKLFLIVVELLKLFDILRTGSVWRKKS